MSFVIIELDDAHNWSPAPGHGVLGPQVIPLNRRPTVLQPSREVAEAECKRLIEQHPGRRFVVFAPVCAGITVKVPTHTTLSGKVVAERGVPTVVQYREEEVDDGIPF